MLGTSEVCQTGSVRKCVCQACKPFIKPKKQFNKCKCKLPEGISKQWLTESDDSLSNSYDEISETGLINKCECIGCRPVSNYKKKRLCRCIDAKLTPLPPKEIQPYSKEKFEKIQRRLERKETNEKTIIEANRVLSEETLKRSKDINNNVLQEKYIDEKKNEGEFILVKTVVKYSKHNIETNKITPVRGCLHDKKYLAEHKETTTSHLQKCSQLKFSKQIVIVEYSKERKSLSNTIIELYETYKKDIKRKMEPKTEKKASEPIRFKLPEDHGKETRIPVESGVYKISGRDIPEDLRERHKELDKHDPNVVYYSKYITEHDAKRIIYGMHRLLHNYILFRCEDREITEGLMNERFLEKLAEGTDLFLRNAYFYDPYYQPISFKRRYGYIEMHLKIGVNDMFANKHRMFKKVFLVIFRRGSVKFILTKFKAPGKINEKNFHFGIVENDCQDVWCRVDFITAIVNRRHRRIRHRVIENLYDTITSNEKGFFKMSEPLEDLWVCIDFDTESDHWSRTERSQFIRMMRRESDPYYIENRKQVAPIEEQLEHGRRKRKRKYPARNEASAEKGFHPSNETVPPGN